MSEYQYYEFLAIDRSLTAKEMAALRALSTRANITPVSFTNEYHWGDFKGNPEKLMQRYFDAHVYVSNWGTGVFMVRLSTEVLARETAEAATVPDILDCETTTEHWIITWRLEQSANDDGFAEEDGRGWMARLAPIRDELLRGDLRSLYIGWLAAVTREMIDDDELEPLSVKGLGNLTAAQQALAEFLEVDPDLLAGAGMGSAAAEDEERSHREMDVWLAGLPPEEVNVMLRELLDGNGQQAERRLRNRFAAWQRSLQPDKTAAPRRTVEKLYEYAETAQKIRLEKQEHDRKQRQIESRRAWEAYLRSLAKDFPRAWKRIQQTVERGSGLAYDEACSALVDLGEAYELQSNRERFTEELKGFMAGHLRRKALVQRLVKAGIWRET